MSQRLIWIAALLLVIISAPPAGGAIVISEFMADNDSTIADEDGQYSDWIEIYNSGAGPVSLDGWYLTDLTTNRTQWRFPSVSVPGGGYLLVFASGKDRAVAGNELHTNFQLDAAGEYLGLFQADGATTVSDFFRTFPPQQEDASYGLTQEQLALIQMGDTTRYLVPNAGAAALIWKPRTFVDSGWNTQPTPFTFSSIPDSGLVSYWKLDESAGLTANDETGLNHGSLEGDPQWQPVGGRHAGAIRLDGTGDLVRIPNETDYDIIGPITVACWLRVNSLTKNWQAIVTKGDNAWRLHRRGITNTLDFAYNGLNPSSVVGSVNINDGGWHHAVGVYDGSNLRLYVDGVLDNSVAVTGTPNNSGDQVMLGENSQATGRHWDGWIDDVAIYNRGLNATEIVQLRDHAVASAFTAQMLGVNATLWTRIHFNVNAADRPDLDSMTLRMKYEDGFAAFINNVLVAADNIPGTLNWNSSALADRADANANTFADFNLASGISALVDGDNVLAVHALNDSAGNGQFVLGPVLEASKSTGNLRYFTTPTPGATNIGGVLGFVGDTNFSLHRGFYTAPSICSITCPTPGVTIHYTLDGSTPSATHGTPFTGTPLNITQTTTLRAIAFRANWAPSNVDTQTYIFLADVIVQSPLGQSPDGATPGGWPDPGTFNGQAIDYGMDPDITGDATWSPQMPAALTQIPTFSIVTDLDNLFSAATGIYVNARSDGSAWERPASAELIYPDGAEGFQIDCGLRIRGGASRSGGNRKHAFRLLFRREYGDTKLRYPLFGDEGEDSFDNMDLRCAQNYSWSFKTRPGGFDNSERCSFVREVFSRDTQRDMGQPYTRSRYYHLYLNGQYWGLFQTQERSEASYAESYFGGQKEDYDVLKVEAGPYDVAPTDGTMDAWQRLYNAAAAGFTANAAYFQAQGMNADGTPNPAYERLVDVDNLIDYIIATYYAGDFDAPISWFVGGPNNFYTIYNRVNPDGFKFFRHDGEHAMMYTDVNPGDTRDEFVFQPTNIGSGNVLDFNPMYLHRRLSDNAEHRLHFADRFHRHFYNDGVMTTANAQARAWDRINSIDTAVIAESARWGDALSAIPLNENDWLTQIDLLINNFIAGRAAVMLTEMRTLNLYPNVVAPTFSPQHGGIVNPGFTMTMSAPAGTVYYSLDGADPRLIGGGVNTSPSIRVYAGETLTINRSTRVIARAYSGGVWSALNDATYTVNNAVLTHLRITEFNYHPYDPTTAEFTAGHTNDDDFEFIEFLNTHPTQTIDLSGCSFINGITYTFAGQPLPLLAPGEYGLLVYNQPAFEARYGASLNILGNYLASGTNLRNSGETVTFGDDTATTIHTFAYSDAAPWPLEADGLGSSLEVIDTEGDYNSYANWRASPQRGGTPGQPPVTPVLSPEQLYLRVTEIHYNPAAATLAETNAGYGDHDDFEFIELMNVSPSVTLDLSGVRFTVGIDVNLSTATLTAALPPGERIVLARKPLGFAVRYGAGIAVAGQYRGQLENSGETLRLLDAVGGTIQVFTYDDENGWPLTPDGLGPSLEVINTAGNYNSPTNWRASSRDGGTPGQDADAFASSAYNHWILY